MLSRRGFSQAIGLAVAGFRTGISRSIIVNSLWRPRIAERRPQIHLSSRPCRCSERATIAIKGRCFVLGETGRATT